MVKVSAEAVAIAGLIMLAGVSTSAQVRAQGTDEQRTMPPTGAGGPGLPGGAAAGAEEKEKPEFPEFKDVTKDFVKVVSTSDGAQSMWTLYQREKDSQLLAELPREFEKQRFFFAMTLAKGSPWAGLQGSDIYVYWRRYDKTLALIAPELENRSTGDTESKESVKQLFTDRVILDIPIVTMGPGGGPVIDLDALLVGQADKFFGPTARGLSANLAAVKEAKAFPENLEVSIEAPLPAPPRSMTDSFFGGSGSANAGRLQTFHYSISMIRENPSYKPREADERVGYFTSVYRDLGELGKISKWKRLINRWHIEKADPKLKMSPPKTPIVFYVEHTVPIRYRRWVRDGVLYWNEAFEKVGISGAMEVYYQDKLTGAHMEKDPEDVRYNFVRWLSNDISTAIGPSRANPLTGEILDADIVLTDGWIRAFWSMSNEILPDIAMENFGPEATAWLARNPQWDPRLRLAPPGQRDFLLAQRHARGVQRFGGHAAVAADPTLMGDDVYDGLFGRTSQMNGMCMAAQGRAADMALAGMSMEIMESLLDLADEPGAGGDKPADGKKDEPKEDKLDGIPETFIGPLLADLVAHEVGHTIGLRHNFKSSAVYTMAQINSHEWKGKKPIGSSVMDYNALPQINMGTGEVQGDFGMIAVGAYDKWAIEYGYTFEDPKKILERVAEPELMYATDEDTWGPDPLARRRDMGADPLTFAKSRMKLAQELRSKIIDRFVKDGDSWAKARRGYSVTLAQHMNSLGIMANWVGGASIARDKKGDPNAREPIVPVPAEQQREALEFVLENAFRDSAFGLSPDLLNKMTVDKWWDNGGINDIFEDETWPIHDRILGIQASVLSMLMNPTSLGRVFDNEYRVPSEKDMITLPEVVNKVTDEIWSELKDKGSRKYSERQPMISSLRRNLQREHLERLIALSMPEGLDGSASKAIATVATHKLRELQGKLVSIVPDGTTRIEGLDMYTAAHLTESRTKIEKALDSIYIYNANEIGGGSLPFFFFGSEEDASGGRDR